MTLAPPSATLSTRSLREAHGGSHQSWRSTRTVPTSRDLSPKGEFWHCVEQVLDLSKNVVEQAKRDLGNSLYTSDKKSGNSLVE